MPSCTTTGMIGAIDSRIGMWMGMGSKACIKTNKSAAKRFRVRGSGSIKRYEDMSV